MKQPIWNLNSDRPAPAHFCDVIIEGEAVTLQVKKGKEKYETMSAAFVHMKRYGLIRTENLKERPLYIRRGIAV